MTWLTNLVDQHKEMESPTSFWMWSGLCSISAVVKDNVWLNRGGAYNLYPNIFCILHADSGLKKGPPIALSKNLVRIVNNTKIISGRSSIQGILKKLGTGQSGNPHSMKSTGYICASELSSSLVEDNAALTILTDLYDRNYNVGEWESLLKMENFNLKDPTVTMFGGINEAHAEYFFGKKDIQGGFLARTFIIHESQSQTINSLMRKLSNPPDLKLLAEYLKDISKISGAFKDTFDENNNYTPAGKFYDDWYQQFRNEVHQMEIKDDTGTLNRFGDSVLKVAMLLSLSRDLSLEISIDDMDLAIKICEKLVGNVRHATMGKKGQSQSAPLKGLIINELLSKTDHRMARDVLMKKFWMHYGGPDEFDELMNGLCSTGMIDTIAEGHKMVYTMPDEQVNLMREYLAGKNK